MKNTLKELNTKGVVISLLGAAILAFGLYQVHSVSEITEGGVLGLTLLLYNHFGISPSLSGLLLNVACYVFGIKVLGRKFIAYSVVSGLGFSGFYALFERFPIIYPHLIEHPLIAAIVGAVFVGVGVGLCVRVGGAPSGDDALAMSLSSLTSIDIKWVYLISDLVVLALSLTYIQPTRLLFSLITVVLSGQIIGALQPKE